LTNLRMTPHGTKYRIITTTLELEELLHDYSAVADFTYDVETIDPYRGDPRRNTVVWLSMACDTRTDVIPMGHPNGDLIRIDYPLLASAKTRMAKGLAIRPQDYSNDIRKATKVFEAPPEQLTPAEVWETLRPLFMGPQTKIGHNIKFDIESITKYLKAIPKGPFVDTLVMSSVLDNRNHLHLGLDDCCKRELNYTMVKGVGKEVEKYTFEEVALYAAIDSEKTHQLRRFLTPRLTRDKLRGIFALEMDLLAVLVRMELTGAPIDRDALQALYDRLVIDVDAARARVFAAAGRAFNLNSNAEKQRLLYGSRKDGGQGLRPHKLTEGGQKRADAGEMTVITDYSTAADALEVWRGKNDLVTAMLDYADLDKLMSTYVIPYLGGEVIRTTGAKSKVVVKPTMLVKGRIHTDFVQYGAETGRMSSRNPNLQNVPNPRTVNGRAIRDLFIAPPGHIMVVADYSQIEPRVIASFSKDRMLMKNYLEGGDVYVTVGSSVGVDRAAGKVLVLAMAYGIGPVAIAAGIGCTVTEAKALMARFEARFPGVDKLRQATINQARIRTPVPYVVTLMGRRRYLPELRSTEYGRRSGAERQCFNTLIQGSAADIIKLAMVRAHSLIPDKARMTLTVHDEIATIAPLALRDETVAAIREAMEGITALDIPLIADIKVVSKWGDAK
jgi:DNA polymerase I-like protein with 3'-5' exonuclease and polymerase domains